MSSKSTMSESDAEERKDVMRSEERVEIMPMLVNVSPVYFMAINASGNFLKSLFNVSVQGLCAVP